MIQGNEIRIGNEYNRKHGKGWTQTTMTEYIIGKIFTDSKDYALNDFEPIPLTPKILEGCGFDEPLSTEYNTHRFGSFAIVFNDSKYNIEYRYSCGDFNMKDELIDVKHLHQLQNIFYFLTGTELEVNLQTKIIP